MQFDMVFEGGGAKGMVFVGAMDEFVSRGHSHGRLLGTSAGAITATLLAAGYSVDEMKAALVEQKGGKSIFSTFMGQPAPLSRAALKASVLSQVLQEIDLPLIPDSLEKRIDLVILEWISSQPTGRHLLSFIESGGWYTADAFLDWIAAKLDSGLFNGQPRAFSSLTFEQFHAATQADLSLIASDTTRGLKLVLNHRTAPQLPIAWAVRMSMSVPLLWQEVHWQPGWGEYLGESLSGDSIVDGGLISNFPIELFISDDRQVQEVMGLKLHDNVLGLLIDESMPVPGAPPPPAANPAESQSSFEVGQLEPVKRLNNLLNTMLEANDKAVVSAFEELVVHLPAEGYGTTEFDMSAERRIALVEAGRQAMRQYLDQLSPGTPTLLAARAPDSKEIAARLAKKMLRLGRPSTGLQKEEPSSHH